MTRTERLTISYGLQGQVTVSMDVYPAFDAPPHIFSAHVLAEGRDVSDDEIYRLRQQIFELCGVWPLVTLSDPPDLNLASNVESHVREVRL